MDNPKNLNPESITTTNSANRAQGMETSTRMQPLDPAAGADPALAPLSAADAQELRDCELVITRSWTTILEVGRALGTIRTKRLYRETHATFEQYCREKFEFSKTHANRLIGAAEVAEVLTPVGVKIQNEFQARHLVGLEPQKILAAGMKAAELAGTGELTAGHIQRAVSEIAGRPVKPPRSARSKKGETWPRTLKAALNLIATAEKAAKAQNMKGVLKALEGLRSCLEHA